MHLKKNLLELLVKSCRSSLARVRDKNKEKYYGLPHQFKYPYEMAAALIVKDNFINDWINQYVIYSNRRKNKRGARPSLGRVDHDKGYFLDNLQVEAIGYNSSRAKSILCTIMVSNDSIIRKDGNSPAYLFSSISINKAIKEINRRFKFKLTRKKLFGNIENGLYYKDGKYLVNIQSSFIYV